MDSPPATSAFAAPALVAGGRERERERERESRESRRSRQVASSSAQSAQRAYDLEADKWTKLAASNAATPLSTTAVCNDLQNGALRNLLVSLKTELEATNWMYDNRY